MGGRTGGGGRWRLKQASPREAQGKPQRPTAEHRRCTVASELAVRRTRRRTLSQGDGLPPLGSSRWPRRGECASCSAPSWGVRVARRARSAAEGARSAGNRGATVHHGGRWGGGGEGWAGQGREDRATGDGDGDGDGRALTGRRAAGGAGGAGGARETSRSHAPSPSSSVAVQDRTGGGQVHPAVCLYCTVPVL